MFRFWFYLLAVLVFLAPMRAMSFSAFKAEYELYYGAIFLGDIVIASKRVSDAQYQIDLHAETSGFINTLFPYKLKEVSLIERSNGWLRTMHYLYEEKKNGDVRKRYDVAVDYDQKKAWRVDHKKPRTWEILTTIPMDKLSFPFIMGDDIERTGEPRSVMVVLDGRQARELELVERTSDEEKEQNKLRKFFLSIGEDSMEVWLDGENNYIPKKIHYISDSWGLKYHLKRVTWLE